LGAPGLGCRGNGKGGEEKMNEDPQRLLKRSVTIAGHATSVSLENAFWDKLKENSAARELSLNQLITEIDETRTGNLSGAIRVYVLQSIQA
jgi:predicted DNA-binding ribbon-helix-helix protein